MTITKITTMTLITVIAIYTTIRNTYGRLGHSDNANTQTPKVVAALADVNMIQIACGAAHTIALAGMVL